MHDNRTGSIALARPVTPSVLRNIAALSAIDSHFLPVRQSGDHTKSFGCEQSSRTEPQFGSYGVTTAAMSSSFVSRIISKPTSVSTADALR